MQLKNVLSFCFLLSMFTWQAQAQEKKFPIIAHYGGVYEIPESENIINRKQKYKIVVDITQGAKSAASMNPAFELVARVMNLYGLAGLPKEKLDIVVILHFEATPVILADSAYEQVFQVKNPNTAVINTLAEAGVRFYICGQSLRARNFVDSPRNPNIKVLHGAMLGITHFQSQGYSLLKL